MNINKMNVNKDMIILCASIFSLGYTIGYKIGQRNLIKKFIANLKNKK